MHMVHARVCVCVCLCAGMCVVMCAVTDGPFNNLDSMVACGGSWAAQDAGSDLVS